MTQVNDTQTAGSRQTPYPIQVHPGLFTSSNLPSTETNRELFRAKAVWYLDIFPDEIVIQEKTVSIIRRKFLYSYVETLPVKDIGEVVVTEAFLFASITILARFSPHKLTINSLYNKKALQAKKIIDGLMLRYQ